MPEKMCISAKRRDGWIVSRNRTNQLLRRDKLLWFAFFLSHFHLSFPRGDSSDSIHCSRLVSIVRWPTSSVFSLRSDSLLVSNLDGERGTEREKERESWLPSTIRAAKNICTTLISKKLNQHRIIIIVICVWLSIVPHIFIADCAWSSRWIVNTPTHSSDVLYLNSTVSL